jgi:hypothetical protein
VIHRCRHRDTGKQSLIKLWAIDVNCPIGTIVSYLDYKPLFENEVKMLKQLSESTVAKYLPVLETHCENSVMLIGTNSIAVVAY